MGLSVLDRLLNLIVKSRGLTGALAVVLVPISLYMVFVYAPTEATMGNVQRIFYYHVGTAWNAFLFFGVVAVSSAIYLATRRERWNTAARTAAELGVLFTTLTLVAGSLWARPIWNVWWTWDPRLTTTLILWFIYIGYLLIQAGASESVGQRRLGAVVGIVGFVDIPLIHFSARLWRSIHPTVIRPESPGMPPEMLVTMILSLLALMFVGLFLWGQRLMIEDLKEQAEVLSEELSPMGARS